VHAGRGDVDDTATAAFEHARNRPGATHERSGETRVETVTAEIKGQGLKHLVKVTIDVDGKKGTKTASVTATDGHPFWVPALHAWIKATDLKAGQWLRTSAGSYVQITAIDRWTAQAVTVHNMTVSDVHTYYVVAGSVPVLVHNCGANQDGYLYRGPGGTTAMTPLRKAVRCPAEPAWTSTLIRVETQRIPTSRRGRMTPTLPWTVPRTCRTTGLAKV
jgi:hypothetical protein